jgi:hypothetical protein
MSATAKNWFDVDREGLAKLLADRSPAFVLFELFSNCADTDAKRIEVVFEPVAGKPYAEISVKDDDPNGFANLAHAWTLFAESSRKVDAEKRGRFNLGEKLVLARCVWAEIVTTTGAVRFDEEGRHALRRRSDAGSSFSALVRMTREEHAQACAEFQRLIPPEGVEVVFNGRAIARPERVATFTATLPTVIADAEGYLRRVQRETVVDVYEPLPHSVACAINEGGRVFELGVPVVATGDRYDYDVRQKIPLNADRDNVPPSYLRTLRALALNATADRLSKQDASRPWVQEAASSELVTAEANDRVLTLQFGAKRAVFDPSDPEANKELINRGYTIISGGSLSAERWENVRRDGIAAPSGQIAPSGVKYTPGGRPENLIDPEDYTPGQKHVVDFAQDLAMKLIARHVYVRIVSEPIARPHSAWYGDGVLTFNLGRLGRGWFETTLRREHLELIVHELSHDKVSDHLTREFADEVGRLSARALDLALVDPDFYRGHGYVAGKAGASS